MALLGDLLKLLGIGGVDGNPETPVTVGIGGTPDSGISVGTGGTAEGGGTNVPKAAPIVLAPAPAVTGTLTILGSKARTRNGKKRRLG